ncbi:signal peptidase II [Arthrobacter sp. NIO-1057]|uniref:signal peptidase II n=1 Tax=Arthrobacter sp. NIO-1057 TaxID=993071 RepID=UPI000817AC15|nr:signal peptidase II [Arthrobacter sp. NIO-1057]SCB93520.1 signal peptidase II [Arthrobacter sp. NIO-1057]
MDAVQAGGKSPSPKKYLGMGLAIALVALVIDQVVKILVERNMRLGESIEVIPGIFNIHYILNPGAAFSIGENFTIVFAILQAAVAIFVIYLLARKVSVRSWTIALGCLLGGVLGNLGDRIFREPAFGFGHVVDMFSVTHFAIFNVADSFIVCSMIAVAFMLIRGRNLDGTIGDTTPKKKAAEGETEPKE